MSGQLDSPASKHKLQVWRSFFREYLRYVSRLEPDILGCKKHIMDIYNNDIKAHKNFDTVFLRRSAKENRKFQQFINLSKGIARLRGDEKVGIVHLTIAKKLFLHSLETLVTNLVPMGMDLSDLNAEQMHLMSTVERLSDNGQYESKIKLIKTLKDSGTNITMQKVDELIASNFLVEGTLDGDPMIEINPEL
jgi:DNA replicative helicase MCM subunit Mcm2 (Cdc46/Mcm family)